MVAMSPRNDFARNYPVGHPTHFLICAQVGKPNETVAVSNLSLRVELGEIFGLLGANGAGKTLATVWQSNFGCPVPSTRRCLRRCICSMARRFYAIDAWKVREGLRNNLTHCLISTQVGHQRCDARCVSDGWRRIRLCGIKFRAPHAIDATLSPWSRLLDDVEAHEGPRNTSQDNLTHWLIIHTGARARPLSPRRL
jgi:hypothetical protein